MLHFDVQQNTPDWHALRCGKVTGSKIDCVMAKGKGGAPSATRATYMGELIAERLSGIQNDGGFKSKAMEHGKDCEPEAFAAYAFYSDLDLIEVAFADHPTIAMSGASPDRLVGDVGLLEMKCPNTATHIQTLLGASIDGAYLKQIQWQLACTGRLWCDYCSFDPRLPEHMKLSVTRVHRDPARIVEIETEVRAFLAELDAKLAALNAKFSSLEAAQ